MSVLTLFACFSTFASNTSIGQVAVIANAMLSMTGRITMLSLSRWTGEGGSYRTILRFFATKLAWQELQVKFFRIFVERLWRTVKQEEVYLKEYLDVWEAEESLRKYFKFYNYERPHQSLNYQTPFEVYQKGVQIKENKGAKSSNF